MMFVALITYQEPVFRAETKMGGRLKKLECDWVGLVIKNYEIEQAVLNMD